ncbi:MAG: hydrogenase nickel incorporation protein HypB [Halodesulfurarchaeum sp.]
MYRDRHPVDRSWQTANRMLRRLIGPIRAHRLGHDRESGAGVSDAESDVLAAIEARAGEIHETLAHDHDVFAVEFVGSTGGGKTALIKGLIERAPEGERIGAVVGDVAGEDDATRLREHGIPVQNVNTGKECHLDPDGVGAALQAFDLGDLDRLFVENVGNMVCPADFPLGASERILVVSTTEGEDVVNKHPLLVQAVDAAVINKVDLAEAVGTDIDRTRRDLKRVAPEIPIFETNAKDGEGVDDLADYLRSKQQASGHVHARETAGGEGQVHEHSHPHAHDDVHTHDHAHSHSTGEDHDHSHAHDHDHDHSHAHDHDHANEGRTGASEEGSDRDRRR